MSYCIATGYVNSHVRFDERDMETESRATAPHLDATYSIPEGTTSSAGVGMMAINAIAEKQERQPNNEEKAMAQQVVID